MRCRTTWGWAATLAVAATAVADDVQVIFSEIPGHPTAVVPGATDADDRPVLVEFRTMERLTVDDAGAQFAIVGRHTGADDTDYVILAGTNDGATVLAQEGWPIPGGSDGEEYEFFGSAGADFASGPEVVFTANARGGNDDFAQKAVLCTLDGDCSVILAQGDACIGLDDQPPLPTGDELFGFAFGSLHLLDGGYVGVHDATIQNVHPALRPALFYNDLVFLQSGAVEVDGLLWESFDFNGFTTTADGGFFVLRGDDDGDESEDDILYYGAASLGEGGLGDVVLREGSPIGESGVIAATFTIGRLAGDGTWFARGDDDAGGEWAVRQGEVVARTGAPIVAGSTELWGAEIIGVHGHSSGGWVVTGTTDAGDPAADAVLVRGGDVEPYVVLREGDPVDLDGNGAFDDDVFIGRGDPALDPFQSDEIHLGENGVIHVLAKLRNAAGEDLGSFGAGGDAYLQIGPDEVCAGDVDGGGVVDCEDLQAVIVAWGECPPGPCAADLDGNGVVDVDDLVIVLLAWGPCP